MGEVMMATRYSSEVLGCTADGVKIVKTVLFCLSGTYIAPITIKPLASFKDWNGSSTGFTISMTSTNKVTAVENLASTTSSHNVINVTPSGNSTSGLTIEIISFGW